MVDWGASGGHGILLSLKGGKEREGKGAGEGEGEGGEREF